MTGPAPSRVTRFATADPGPAARVLGFVGHLRDHGFRLGPAETGAAMAALGAVNPTDPHEARLALRAVCTGSAEDVERFDDLFDAFWLAEGRVRTRVMPTPTGGGGTTRSTRTGEGAAEGGAGAIHAPDEDASGDGQGDGEGELMATRAARLSRMDLREMVSPDDIRDAETVARRLGLALRDRRSRRRRAAKRGAALDLRRTIRRSLATGGEPLSLARRRRPDRPTRIVALVDVSGSMTHYARPFLAFLGGLMRADAAAEAFLFHTRLVRITGALRDGDPMRALGRIAILAEGMGGGSRIGESLSAFAGGPAKTCVDGRTVVLILSDGYDSAAPETVGAALGRLRRRGCRIIWLNPLKYWADYAPVARGMAAALPHLDDFAAAATLADLAALDRRLARL